MTRILALDTETFLDRGAATKRSSALRADVATDLDDQIPQMLEDGRVTDIGVYLGLSSVILWGLLFFAIDVHGYFRRPKETVHGAA